MVVNISYERHVLTAVMIRYFVYTVGCLLRYLGSMTESVFDVMPL